MNHKTREVSSGKIAISVETAGTEFWSGSPRSDIRVPCDGSALHPGAVDLLLSEM